MRRKLIQRGIDPITHKPISDLNLLTNLSQLLSPQNFGHLMNPNWDNSLIRSQVLDASTHLAKIQLVQSIMQVINTSTPFSNLSESSLLGPQNNIAEFGGLLCNTSDPPPQTPFGFPSLGESPQLLDTFPAVTTNSMRSFEGGFEPEFVGVNCNNLNNEYYCAKAENGLLPPLVSAFGVVMSPGGSHLEDGKINSVPTFSSIHSPKANMFEDWEKFLDSEANAPWKDMMD